MTSPVLTITLNPALDQTVRLPALHHGQVNIATEVTLNAGGKGVNVAGCLADWGTPVVVSGILGQENVAPFSAMFRQKGITDHFIQQPGNTRINIKLVSDDDGETTDVNLPGLLVSADSQQQLAERLPQLCSNGSWVVLAGSLPVGLPTSSYASLIEKLNQLGARVLLDTSGAALSAALSGPALPYCIKPNRHELEQWAGHALPTLQQVTACAQALQRQGIAQVVVSMAEQGALFVSAEGAWLASPPPVTPVSSVGAGDALVAGWVAAQYQGRSWEESMRLALAFAAGELAKIGPHLPASDVVEHLARAVTLSRIQD
jgi:1-phosphofructokinase